MTGGISTNRGVIGMDRSVYQSTATVGIKVIDTGLNVDPGAPDTVDINMTSTTEATPEVVTLTETANASSVFAGSINLVNGPANPGDGLLQVANGDTITAEYFDNDDGLGGRSACSSTKLGDATTPCIRRLNGAGAWFHPPPRWSAGPYQTSLWSSPIFGDGTLFETTWDGPLRARDPYSGTIQWDRKLGVSGARTGTPSFDNGVLYTAFAGQLSDQLYALDATTGDTLWVVDRGVGVDVNPDLPLLATDGLVFGLAFSGETS